MQRAERLFQLLTLLRNRRTVLTARQLSEHMQVSERTIYRDIQALSLSGVPVEGEAGVGYRLQRHFQLPPLMFDRHEVEALLLGARMVSGWGDRQMANSANHAIQKILAVLPDHLRHSDENLPLLVPTFDDYQKIYTAHSQTIREAIRQKHILVIDYQSADDQLSSRRIEPLGLIFWGKVWTLIAWCQLRGAYRAFRLDRIQQLVTSDEIFTTEDKKSLKHYLQLMAEHYEQHHKKHDEQWPRQTIEDEPQQIPEVVD